MYTRLFLFLGISVALTASAFAQSNNFQSQTAANTVDGLSRPRVAEVKTAGVKSSVIVNTAAVEHVVFDLINQKRAAEGLGPLVWNDAVAYIARLHSQHMVDQNFFGHRDRDEKMVSDRADENGLKKWRAIGENIAFNRGYDDPVEKAVDLWLNSPSHRHNLMDSNWKESAVGVAIAADGSYYFTQVFLLRK
ncbi:hypothetical protein BH10ACI3_BH10ACI3_14680 [soil metagenome]